MFGGLGRTAAALALGVPFGFAAGGETLRFLAAGPVAVLVPAPGDARLEPALGGELYATYHKNRFHGDVNKAKYYSATVVFCFDHLHKVGLQKLFGH